MCSSLRWFHITLYFRSGAVINCAHSSVMMKTTNALVVNSARSFHWYGELLGFHHGLLLWRSSWVTGFTSLRLVGVVVSKFYVSTGEIHASPLLYAHGIGSFLQMTPAQSQESNHDCLPGTFFDYHDLWHILAAIALYSTASVRFLHASAATFAFYCSHYTCTLLYALDKRPQYGAKHCIYGL